MLNSTEEVFVRQALKHNAPGTFISHHLWICRQLKIKPDIKTLEEVDDEVQDFILKPEDS